MSTARRKPAKTTFTMATRWRVSILISNGKWSFGRSVPKPASSPSKHPNLAFPTLTKSSTPKRMIRSRHALPCHLAP